jgi:hypothetical protein
MPEQQNVKKGSSRKIGNRKRHCDIYRNHGTLLKNKIKRILRSNGITAASSYRRDPNAKFPKELK